MIYVRKPLARSLWRYDNTFMWLAKTKMFLNALFTSAFSYCPLV